MIRRWQTAAVGTGAALAARVGLALLSRHRERRACACWLTFDQTNGATRFIHAATLDASAHNAQPWRFEITDGCLTLRADLARNIGVFDPFRREMYQSLGCAIENLAVAGHVGIEREAIPLPNDFSRQGRSSVGNLRSNMRRPRLKLASGKAHFAMTSAGDSSPQTTRSAALPTAMP